LDFFYGILFAAACVLELAGSTLLADDYEFVGNVGNIPWINSALPGLMACFFLVDGILMVSFMRHINDFSSGSFPLSKLRSETSINVITNSVTFLAYIAWRVFFVINFMNIGEAAIGKTPFIFIAVIFVLVLLSKFLKVAVMLAFMRMLDTPQDSTALLNARIVQPVIAAMQEDTSPNAESLDLEAGSRGQ
jgi:hypothetical protein